MAEDSDVRVTDPADGLELGVDGFGNVPLIAEVLYELDHDQVSLDVGSGLFCFDFENGNSSGGLRFDAWDASGHVVMDELRNLSSFSFNHGADRIEVTTEGSVHCFVSDAEGDLVLVGDYLFDMPNQQPDELFRDRFQAKAEVSVVYSIGGHSGEGQPEITPGSTLEYQVSIINNRDSGLDRVAFQELLPTNGDYFDGYVQEGIWSCQPSGEGASCGGNDAGDGPIRLDNLQLAPSSSITFTATRTVPFSVPLGSEIVFKAGAVGADGPELAPESNADTLRVLVVEGD